MMHLLKPIQRITSMSLLTTYASLEAQVREMQQKLEKMHQDPRLAQELEFKEKLEALMKEYGKTAVQVIRILDPNDLASRAGTAHRRRRRLKVYRNPHTNEVIETRGGNHKTLKSWKDEFGSSEVEAWVERTED